MAIENRDIVALERLLREGANAEAKGTNGVTPLMNAAESGQVPLISLLLENGSNPNAKDEQGETALTQAARRGYVNAVNLLAQLSDTKGKNQALFAAVEGGPVRIIGIADTPNPPPPFQPEPGGVEVSWSATVEALLDGGAEIEARNEDGSSPLTWAAAYAQTDVFNLLIDKGAKIDVRDKRGDTPLMAAACQCALATMNSAYDVIKTLLDHGANVNTKS